MTMPALDKLSLEDRLALLEAVCESLAEQEADLKLSPEHQELVRRRLEAYRADPKPGIPVDQAIAEIQAARK